MSESESARKSREMRETARDLGFAWMKVGRFAEPWKLPGIKWEEKKEFFVTFYFYFYVHFFNFCTTSDRKNFFLFIHKKLHEIVSTASFYRSERLLPFLQVSTDFLGIPFFGRSTDLSKKAVFRLKKIQE